MNLRPLFLSLNLNPMEKTGHMERLEALGMLKARHGKLCALTAYDAPTARLLHSLQVDMLFVGDSVGTNVLGYASERDVRIEDIEHHVAAVRRGAPDAVILADLPWLTYETSQNSVKNARRLVAAGASLVKVEGANQTANIEALCDEGITVCAHLGFTPQTLGTPGGKAKVQARSVEDAMALVSSAEKLQTAGAAFLVLELVPDAVSKVVTERLRIPTIGIGAGPDCDGQVLIIHDVLGLSGLNLRLAKKYVDGNALFSAAVNQYRSEVLSGTFPAEENTFHMDPDSEAKFRAGVSRM